MSKTTAINIGINEKDRKKMEETGRMFQEKLNDVVRVLRDADKLDIWRVVIGHYSGRGRTPKVVNEFVLSGNGFCSPPVLAALKNGRVVPIDAVRSVCDAKLLYISWVYDLNFPASFRETLRNRYLDRLSATIPMTPDIRRALQCASDHAARSAGGL